MNNALLQRPLGLFCGTFFISFVIFTSLNTAIKLLVSALAIFAALIFIFFKFKCSNVKPHPSLPLSLAAAVLLSSIISCYFYNFKPESFEKYDSNAVSAEVSIKEIRYSSSYYGYYTAYIKSLDSDLRCLISLGLPDVSLMPGDILYGEITLSSLSEFKNGINEKQMLLPDGIFMTGEADSLKFIRHDNSYSYKSFFSKINRSLTAKIMSASNNDAGALASAILLGNRSYLPDNIKRDFSRLGISHLLAISGLHVSIIISAMEIILSRTKLKRNLRSIILILITVLFMSITGFSPSVMRAGIMHILRISAGFLGREYDSLTALASSAMIIVMFNPYSAVDTGLWLSILSSYACIIYAQRISHKKPKKGFAWKLLNNFLDCIRLTLLIIILTLPVIWYIFGNISLLSPITNFIFIPAITILLIVSIPFLILAIFNLLVAPAVWLLNFTAGIIISLAKSISVLPEIVQSVKYPGVLIFIALIFLTVIIIPLFQNKKLYLYSKVALSVFTSGLIICIVLGNILLSRTCSITLINEGKNDGVVIRSGRSYILADSSGGSNGFANKLLYAAQDKNAVEIDAYLLTHYHKKHVSSIEALSDKTILRSVLMPVPENEDEANIIDAIISMCDNKNIKTVFYNRKNLETLDICGIELEFFDYLMPERSTHPIVSFAANISQNRFVYAGASFHEGPFEISEAMSAADLIFLGNQFPVYKKEITARLSGVTVAASEAFPYITDQASFSTKELTIIDGEYTVDFSKVD